MARLIDITGNRYGRLVVVGRSGTRGKNSTWLCVCDCGVQRVVLKSSLTGGATQSCGCLQKEVASTTVKRRATHGMRGGAEYAIFSGIRRRCTNPKEEKYANYGGRGVECRFRGFAEFFAEVGWRPSPAHSVDRIDPEGHYEKGNIRWATPDQQARNRRNAVKVEIGGRTRPLKDWCEDLGQPYHRCYLRLKRYGWTAEQALLVGARQ